MPRRTVEIVILGKDELTGKLNSISGGLSTFGKALLGAGTVGVGAIGAVGAAATKLAYDAAQVEPIRVTFENLAESIGETSRSMLEELRPATMNTLSDIELMEAANKLMAMGLAESAEEAAGLAEMATTLGTAMGEDAGVAMENFTLMLANQSIPRLDTFGISSGNVRQRIEELMEATEGLTREQAFMQAVMEEGATAMDRVGDVSDTGAVKMAQFRTTMTNLKDTIGNALLPIFQTFLDRILMPLATRLTEITSVVGEWLPSALGELGDALTGQQPDWEAMYALLAEIFGPEMANRILDVFDNVLIPAMQSATDFFQNQLVPTVQNDVIPALQNLAAFLLELAQAALPILQQAIQFVVDHWQIFAAIAAAIGVAILAITHPIALLIGALGLLATAWANNWGGIQDKVRAVWEGVLQPIFRAIGEVINWIITNILPPLMEMFSNAWTFIQEVVAAAWEGIRPHLEQLQGILSDFWEQIQPRLEEAWNAIKSAMETVANWVVDTLIPALQDLWDRLEPVREIIIKVAGEFASFMGSAFINSLKLWLQGIISLWDGVSSAIQTVIGWLQTFIGWIQDALAAWNELTAAGAGTARGGGAAAGIHQAGLAYVPTSPYLAFLHRGEAVLSPRQAQRWRGGEREGAPSYTIIGNIDSAYGIDGIEEALDDALDRASRHIR